MNRRVLLPLLAPALLLAGCYTTPQRPSAEQSPPPLPTTTQTRPAQPEAPAPVQEEGVQISAYEPASTVPLTPLHSSAVQSLLRSAEEQERSRDLAGAVGTLERALRIEPRNAHLWHRLAGLRFQQGRYSQAAGLAEKSLALAGGDNGLKRDNWRLIADSKRADGDEAGARVAERKARLVR